jgi:Mrp family chromosome partitioning ATPase
MTAKRKEAVALVNNKGGVGKTTSAVPLAAGISAENIGQDLDGYLAVEVRVHGPVDAAHTAAAQLIDDPVMRDGFADHRETLHRQFAHCNQNDLKLLSL